MRLSYAALGMILLAGLLPGVLLQTAPARAQTGGGAPASPASAGAGANPYAGSVPAPLAPGVLAISLQDAITRGLKQNLGPLLADANVSQARGQRLEQLSALLPNATASPFYADSKINLGELGLTKLGPITAPPSITFHYGDARASVNQQIFNLKEIDATHAATEGAKSAQFSYQDARDVVVLAVGNAYLQAIADEARVATADAQVRTAQAIYQQAADQVTAGTSPAIDGLRARVQLQTEQQQLIQARNDYAIQKLAVARAIGLAPGQQFDLTDKSPYQPFEGITLDDALKAAYAARADYQAAMADVRSAEFSRKAAAAGYLPSASFHGDYGVGGQTPQLATQVFNLQGTLLIPIFQGGIVHAQIVEADARLAQGRERLANLQGQIDADVRTALLNLQSAEDQVTVARSNIDLADQALTQSSDRFQAGVTDTVEVVQAEQTVVAAHEQYIASLYAYNLAKISLARAIGGAEAHVPEYLRGK